MGIIELDEWARAQSGDDRAFGAIFERHSGRVYRHALKTVSSSTDAEDVVAVAFLELWRRRARVRIVGESVLPWLLVTATNAGLNLIRSRRRYRALLERIPHENVAADPAEDLAERDESSRRRAELAAAIANLPTKHRQIISLCDFEGLTIAEAAQALGVAPGTVKSRLHRARHGIGEQLHSTLGNLVPSEGEQS